MRRGGMMKCALLVLLLVCHLSCSASNGLPELHSAAATGDLETVVRLMSMLGSSAGNEKAPGGITPLHAASRFGKVEIVALLLDKGAAVTAASDTGVTALHLACKNGHLDVARALIERGGAAALDAQTKVGATPLHYAVINSQIEVARLAVESGGPAAVERKGESGGTALHVAARIGKTEMVSLLLEHGREAVRIPADTGHMPLHVACYEGHLEVSRLLINAGAVVDAQDHVGDTPLHIAVSHGHTAVALMLIANGGAASSASTKTHSGTTILHIAIENGESDVTKLLIMTGAAVDSQDIMGRTPLHAAAAAGRPEIVRLLIKQGALMDAVTPGEGHSPLYISVYMSGAFPDQEQFLQVVKALLDAGALTSTKTRMGSTPLHAAAYFAHDECARLLKQHGAMEDEGYFEHVEQGRERFRMIEQAATQAHLPKLRSGGTSFEDICIRLDGADAMQRAVDLYKRDGVVVFPELVSGEMIERLMQYINNVRDKNCTLDRSGTIRSPSFREYKGIAVSYSGQVIESMAEKLEPFLRVALRHNIQLLTESNFMATLPGSKDQDWHSDVPALDDRFGFVQIALTDTELGQGLLRVVPGTHLRDRSIPSGSHTVPVTVGGLPKGSVTFYSPNLLHRGTANTHEKERVSLTFALIGANGLLPPGFPYTIQPEDAWRWHLVDGKLREREKLVL